MGGDDQRYVWRHRDHPFSDHIQGICVTDKGHPGLDGMAQALLGPIVLTESGADDNDALAVAQCRQRRRIIEPRDHEFGMPGERRRDVFRAGGQRHQTRAGSQRGASSQQCRATHAPVTTNHQHMTEVSLVRGR